MEEVCPKTKKREKTRKMNRETEATKMKRPFYPKNFDTD